jgi:hypothetical protein
MERDMYAGVVAALAHLGLRLTAASSYAPARHRFSDALIVGVYFWAAVHDRPVCWACAATNWPDDLRPARMPSQSQMSRRLRTEGVIELMSRLDTLVLERDRPEGWASLLDGKPLPVASHSRDRDAAWGRGAGGRAKGYKLHARHGPGGRVLDWAVMPMNHDERTVAERMLRERPAVGYVLADKNYDSNRLHRCVTAGGAQLVAPRRYGAHRGLGHGKQEPGRLRSRDLLENTVSTFGRELHAERRAIERDFGYLASTSGLLTHLPAWVRTLPRVTLWVRAKLILAQIRRTLRKPLPRLDG